MFIDLTVEYSVFVVTQALLNNNVSLDKDFRSNGGNKNEMEGVS